MALLKHQLNRLKMLEPLKASTLVETLVAMIIVMLAFGIGLMIYLNVIQSSGVQKRLNANLQMNQIAIEAVSKNLLADDEYKLETMKIVKTVQPYSSGSDKLKLLTIVAFDGNNKKIGERKELVAAPGIPEVNESK